MPDIVSKVKNFFSGFDIRILLVFFFIGLIGIIFLIFRLRNHVDCENTEFFVLSENFLLNENIDFYNETPNAKSWEWDFGDGTEKAFEKSVTHKYKEAGNYIVKLTINGSCQLEKEVKIKRVDELYATRQLPAVIAPGVVRVGDPVKFDVYAYDGEEVFSAEWSFGETANLDNTENTPTYIYQTPGEKRVTVIVNGDYNNIGFKNIFVKPREAIRSTYGKYKRQIKKAELPPGPIQKDPLDEYVESLPIAPTEVLIPEVQEEPKPEDAPAISEEQFELLLLKVAKQEMTKEDFAQYLCDDYTVPVLKNGEKLMTFIDFCKDIKDKEMKVESLRLEKDPNNRNCIVSININFKVKKYLIWVTD
ncbi:MAG: PKD domain-containing protein [Moheibacter sp.]